VFDCISPTYFVNHLRRRMSIFLTESCMSRVTSLIVKMATCGNLKSKLTVPWHVRSALFCGITQHMAVNPYRHHLRSRMNIFLTESYMSRVTSLIVKMATCGNWKSKLKVPWHVRSALLWGYYAVYGRKFLPTFRDHLSVPSSRVKK
jgi:hypothetical protein